MPTISVLRDPEAVRRAVAESSSIREALESLGLRAGGGNYRAFHEACDRLGLIAPVMPKTSQVPPPGQRFTPTSDEDVFCENSRFLNRSMIKQRLKQRGVPQVCVLCGQGDVWNGLPLVLHLDHINGVYNDNRMENLRLLCPNCHSQTATYAGRSSRLQQAA